MAPGIVRQAEDVAAEAALAKQDAKASAAGLTVRELKAPMARRPEALLHRSSAPDGG